MKSMKQIAKEIGDWRYNKRFYTPPSICNEKDREAMLGKLMLVVTEVAEAAEAVRDANEDHFRIEIADTLIRLLDICNSMGIDPEQAIERKMKINRERPEKHGRQVSL